MVLVLVCCVLYSKGVKRVEGRAYLDPVFHFLLALESCHLFISLRCSIAGCIGCNLLQVLFVLCRENIVCLALVKIVVKVFL